MRCLMIPQASRSTSSVFSFKTVKAAGGGKLQRAKRNKPAKRVAGIIAAHAKL